MSGNGAISHGRPAEAIPLVDDAEIVVVGGGPAGAVAAKTMAERGHDVLVIDQSRFPRDKPCGDGLTRASVECATRFGLEELLRNSQHIEGVRVVHDHSDIEHKLYQARPGRARYGACVSRMRFDEALLQHARSAGARVLHARVDGPIAADGRVLAVRLGREGDAGRIAARHFVAADGVTSRMRREIGVGHEPRVSAYGIRQYFYTERPLDPVFDLYVPVRADAVGVAGYGWVFPLGEHLANVGLGYYRGGAGRLPPIRRALAAFVEELGSRASHRFGSLEPAGKPFGSPVGIGFQPGACEFENVVFVGDAARTTDPLTGEGIGNAMEGAETVAHLVDRALRRRKRPSGTGTCLARRFPRISQDVSTIGRAYLRSSLHEDTSLDGTAKAAQSWDGAPVVELVRELITCEESDPSMRGDALWKLLADRERACAPALEDVSGRVLDALGTDFPMALEILHRRFRSSGGPVMAAMALASSAAVAGEPREDAIVLATALELVELAVELTAEIVDGQPSKRTKINNALAVLLTDHVAARSLVTQVPLGAGWVERIARLSEDMARGRARLAERAYDVATPAHRLESLRLARGSIGAFAARGAAELSGASGPLAASLERCGHELGMALAIADEISDLLVGDELLERQAGHPLRWGRYPLAVSYAVETDRELGRLLHGGLSQRDVSELVERLRRSDGMDRAMAGCQVHADAARAALDEPDAPRWGALNALGILAVARATQAAQPSANVRVVEAHL